MATVNTNTDFIIRSSKFHQGLPLVSDLEYWAAIDASRPAQLVSYEGFVVTGGKAPQYRHELVTHLEHPFRRVQTECSDSSWQAASDPSRKAGFISTVKHADIGDPGWEPWIEVRTVETQLPKIRKLHAFLVANNEPNLVPEVFAQTLRLWAAHEGIAIQKVSKHKPSDRIGSEI